MVSVIIFVSVLISEVLVVVVEVRVVVGVVKVVVGGAWWGCGH